jgi:GNAT superfamily N-acetyltransferase
MDVVYGFLSSAYWSPGISREMVEKCVANSLVVGVYDPDGRQVGFARMVTDYARFGWVSDVFVLEPHRRRGLGQRMVRALVEHPSVRTLRRIILTTRDAHGVYRKCGFEPLDQPERFMHLRRTGPYLT